MARRLQLPAGQLGAFVTDVDPDSSAAGSVRPGDVILEVNRVKVSNAADANRELQKVASGRIAQLMIWRDMSRVFLPVKKD